MINLKKWSFSIACALALPAATAWSQTSVAPAIEEQVKAEDAAVASQKRITKLDDDATGMLGEYRQGLAETEGLVSYNEQLEVQVKSQNEELGTMNTQLSEIENTAREVAPMMTKMLDTLDTFVQVDVPFLLPERTKRIETLRTMMTRADVSLSEKYRRLVEAYQIEMEYGRTVEAYQGKVGEKTVNFMRTGRVALLYQTIDGKETGYWNADSKTWTIDNSYGPRITSGLKVAKKESAPDFLFLPIHAPMEIR